MPPADRDLPGRRVAAVRDRLVRRPILTAFVVALAARAVVAVTSFTLDRDVLFPDETSYLAVVRLVAHGHSAGSFDQGFGQNLYSSSWAFTGPVAFLMRFLGDSRLVGQGLAALAGAAVAAATVVLAGRWSRPTVALGAGLVVALLPSQVLWSSVVLRESVVWLALVLVALGVSGVADRGRRPALAVVLAGAGVWGLTYSRGQTAAVAVVAVLAVLAVTLVALCVPASARRRPGVGPVLALVLAAVLLPAIGGLGPAGMGFVLESRGSLGANRALLGESARSALAPSTEVEGGPIVDHQSRGRGAYRLATRRPTTIETPDGRTVQVVQADDGTLIAVDDGFGADLRAVPRGLVATLLRPWPWEPVASRGSSIVRGEGVVWLVLYGLALVGAVLGRRRDVGTWFTVLLVLGLAGTSALSQGNVGTAFRHRGQLTWALAALAALGVESLLARRTPAGASSATSPRRR